MRNSESGALLLSRQRRKIPSEGLVRQDGYRQQSLTFRTRRRTAVPGSQRVFVPSGLSSMAYGGSQGRKRCFRFAPVLNFFRCFQLSADFCEFALIFRRIPAIIPAEPVAAVRTSQMYNPRQEPRCENVTPAFNRPRPALRGGVHGARGSFMTPVLYPAPFSSTAKPPQSGLNLPLPPSSFFVTSAVKSGCGLLPAKCVWLPLAESQMLCLPHLAGG
jgi:hypothetical protein